MASTMTEPTAADPEARRPGDPAADARWTDIFWALPRSARWLVYVVIGVVLLLVVGALAGTGVVRRPFPQTGGDLEVPGLAGEVEVVRDDHGIPQLYGDSVTDLMTAQGYVHAQERFYEMDVRRHVTSGRLSELFGEETVETDKAIRTMGWRRVAEQELGLVSPDTRQALDAYAAGVNAYLAEHGPSELAVEYSVLRAAGLDYTPEPWTPADSLAWLKAMAWDLRGNMEDEIGRALASVAHTPQEVAELYPSYDEDAVPPVVDQGAVVDGVYEQDATRSGTRRPQRPRPSWTEGQADALASVADVVDAVPALLGHGDGIGSNSWVVSGDRTESGAPILANDPHLGVSMPGIWMQMGLHCRQPGPACPLDVAGFTFSGVPGVVIGHNADIAWGFTNMGPDVTDLFVEHVRGDRWRRGGRWLPLRTRTETIEVRGGDDVELRVRRTAHGPLLSDVDPELATVGANAAPADAPDDEYAVALAWTALRPRPTADALLEMNLASDWREFRAAASSFAAPAQNITYADREGHIGYQAPGLIPIRQSGNDGTVPARGWRREDDWTGEWVPYAGLPNVLDPEDGFVVSANQQVVGGDYPYFLTGDWDRGYRATRIHDLLEDADDLTVQDMADLQLDDRNPLAPALVPYLLDVEALGPPYYRAGQELLEDWDFSQPADSAAAAYFNVVWRNLLALTFHDDLREPLWPDGGARWMAVVTALLEDPSSPWWDDARTDLRESRDDILRVAMRDARDDLTAQVGLNPDDWTWGALHRLELENATVGRSGVSLVEWVVNRGDYRVGGSGSAVNATAWDATQGFRVSAAPSMRMVVTPDDWDRSRWVNLTGVSGHPFNAHYVDQTELWVEGETLPWAFTRDAVAEAADDELTLVPGEEPAE
jgi:penicillin amidase